MSTIVWTNSTEPPLEYKWSDAQDYTFWAPDPSAHTLAVEALPPHTHPDWVLGDLAAAQANTVFAGGADATSQTSKPHFRPLAPGDLADDTVAEYILHSGSMPFVEVIIPSGACVIEDVIHSPITPEALKKVRDGFLAVIQQIEAEQKAKPVMNAIQAMHRATRSDGRPPLYVDPLRAPDA